MKVPVNVKVGLALSLGVLGLGWLGGCTTTGVKPPPSFEPQQVQTVLDRWTQALGGVPALEKLQGLEVRATVELASGGAKFEVHTWQTAANLYRSELSFINGTNLVEAYDGKIAWRRSSLLGFGFVPPAELEVTLRRDSIRAALNVNTDYPDRRLLPDAVFGGRLCHGISLATRGGLPEKYFFDAENGRLLRLERSSSGGPTQLEVLEFSDYRAVGGVILPYVLTVKNEKSDYTVRRIEVVPDPLVGNSLWTPPAEVLREGLKVAGILDRYAETAGGLTALSRIRTRITEQEVEMPTTGVKYHTTLSQKRPNLVLLEQNLPGIGRVIQGYDGTTAWVNSELQGYRELKGGELRQVADNSDLRTNVLIAQRCPLRRLIGPREVNGKKTTAIAMATMQGPAGLYYFRDEDGRLVRIESTIAAGAQGTIGMTFNFSDFRTVDGLTLPFLTTATNPALTTVTKILSVKHNVPLEDSVFKPRKDDT